ncbi:MAG: (2Fe-2S)-binding protein [Hyphomicrobiaceae bacterium]
MTTSSQAPHKQVVRATINGELAETMADPRDTLLELLRGPLGLSGTKEGCSNGNCGSCTVLLDGEPVCSCLVLAAEVDGAAITTIEGIADGNRLHAVQQALIDAGGTQCGFCTPGIVLSAVALLARTPSPDAHQIRHAIAGNICRCTGYDKIVKAIADAAGVLRSGGPA